MAIFIMKGKYSAEGIKRITTVRTNRAEEIIKQHGGKLVAAYAVLGDYDLLFIAEFPGMNEVIKSSVAFNSAFGIAFSSVPAITVTEFDKIFSVIVSQNNKS